MTATGDIAAPSRPQGTPRSKCTTMRRGGSGFENASRDSTQASSGRVPCEVSVSLPPMLTPQRPRLIE